MVLKQKRLKIWLDGNVFDDLRKVKKVRTLYVLERFIVETL